MAYTTIDKPSDYFNTVLYTGNGSTQSITGVGFQPDWVWIKNRAVTSNHNIYDAVRGVQKPMYANATNAESTVSTGLTSFDTDGFSVGSNADHNGNTQGHVAWNWLGANGTASNTDGSITSTVSANTTAGFSIISYTGTATSNETIGHGLGVAPKITIFKRRDGTPNWRVQTTVIDGSYDSLYLNTTGAKFNSNEVAPTSSVITIDNGDEVNASGGTYIAYSFAEKQGYSKFGSYTGNGNADGTFVYTGFKPAFFMLKAASGGTASSRSWRMLDNTRDTFNVTDTTLYPNEDIAEDTGGATSGMDFVSNGIKIRGTSAAINESGTTYIYMAFSENPFVSSGGIPCTAR